MSTSKRYIITLDGDEPMVVDLCYDAAAARWRAEVDGEELMLCIEQVDSDGTVWATLDGERVALSLAEDSDGNTVLGFSDRSAQGVAVRARTPGEIVLAEQQEIAPAVEQGPVTVLSPITGEVLKVSVGLGEAVVVDQGLVIVEAMKMETVVRSVQQAYVREILVSAGDRVRTGDPLVTLSISPEP